jgi:two-component system response regulator TctD
MARVLLAEDSLRLSGLLVECLNSVGYVADAAQTIAGFEELRHAARYDLYVINWPLPDCDGLQLIKRLRVQSNGTPVLVISVRSHIRDRISALDCGADDYLIKPFNHDEFLARTRALLRRPAVFVSREVCAGDVTINRDSGETRCKGRVLPLRPSEARLLALLATRQGHVVSRGSIESSLSRYLIMSENAIDKLVSRLRRVMNESSLDISIRTIKGAGYVLEQRLP